MKLSFSVIYMLAAAALAGAITHPGLLHTEADFARVASFVNDKAEPWYTGWQKLVARTNPEYQANPQEVLCRGSGWDVACKENYAAVFRDAASAYANAIYWKITGDTAYADAAARTLDAWSSTLKTIDGSSDKFLASGIYGY